MFNQIRPLLQVDSLFNYYDDYFFDTPIIFDNFADKITVIYLNDKETVAKHPIYIYF